MKPATRVNELYKKSIISEMQRQVNAMQAVRSLPLEKNEQKLSFLENSFVDKIFPTTAIHEFISYENVTAAATSAFILSLANTFLSKNRFCLWISLNDIVFPSALKQFGIAPDNILFTKVSKPKDALWAIEEALKCSSIAFVIGEVPELTFNESRRLQLAVENSNTTGFIHRKNPRIENTVACNTRWRIQPIPSFLDKGLPGVGFPKWRVNLSKVRNGKPGVWDMEWVHDSLRLINNQLNITSNAARKIA